MLGPEDIRLVQFPTTGPFERGYRKADVDAFLQRLAASLQTPGPERGSGPAPEPAPTAQVGDGPLLTPDDVRYVAFSKPPLGKRGYNEDEVDAFLDAAEATVAALYAKLAAYERQER